MAEYTQASMKCVFKKTNPLIEHRCENKGENRLIKQVVIKESLWESCKSGRVGRCRAMGGSERVK